MEDISFISFSIFLSWFKVYSKQDLTGFRLLAISPDIRRVRSLANHRGLVSRQKSLNQVRCFSCSIIFLKMKIRQGTKHYLTQMLLVIKWFYWQAERNSRMRMMVQGRIMKVRFIEIHQVFTKKKKCCILF